MDCHSYMSEDVKYVRYTQHSYYDLTRLRVWLLLKEYENVAICLGAFHTVMVYLNVIGQHMTNCGSSDTLVESGTYSETLRIAFSMEGVGIEW